MTNPKIFIKSLRNQDKYNHISIEKSQIFLDNLQTFVVNVGLEKVNSGEYEFDGKSYGLNTFYTLFYEDPKKDFELVKLTIKDFPNGQIVRYFNKNIELLIIFLAKEIKLIFYCNAQDRKKIIDSLLKFCKIMKPSK